MDTLGRLTREEMRNEVRRKLDLLRYTINTVGEETALQQINRLISNEDLNMYLNMALQRRCVDVNIADNTIMADEFAVDVVQNKVEYTFPADLMFLRAVYYKPQGTAYTLVPPNNRYMLYEQDSDEDIASQPTFDQIRTYRRRLNMIVLNQVPGANNPGGLLFDYTKSMLALLADDQVLETPLAFILQQVIMQDAAVEATAQKLKLDTSELRATQGELVGQLQAAVLNYHAPKTIRLLPGTMIAYPPYVRRPNAWQTGFGWNGSGNGWWGW